MCICIIKPPGKTVPRKHIFNSWHGNDAGAGFAVVKSNDIGTIHTHKGLMNLSAFLKKYDEEVTEDDCAIIHFRKGQTTNAALTHPFTVGDMQMIHNGTLHLNVPPEFISDTDYFAWRLDEFTKRYPSVDFLEDSFFRLLLCGFLWENPYSYQSNGAGNCMVFLKPDGTWHIINEKGKHNKGGWEDSHESDSGCWYSNNSWRFSPTIVVKPATVTPRYFFRKTYNTAHVFFDSQHGDFVAFPESGMITSKSIAGIKQMIDNALETGRDFSLKQERMFKVSSKDACVVEGGKVTSKKNYTECGYYKGVSYFWDENKAVYYITDTIGRVEQTSIKDIKISIDEGLFDGSLVSDAAAASFKISTPTPPTTKKYSGKLIAEYLGHPYFWSSQHQKFFFKYSDTTVIARKSIGVLKNSIEKKVKLDNYGDIPESLYREYVNRKDDVDMEMAETLPITPDITVNDVDEIEGDAVPDFIDYTKDADFTDEQLYNAAWANIVQQANEHEPSNTEESLKAELEKIGSTNKNYDPEIPYGEAHGVSYWKDGDSFYVIDVNGARMEHYYVEGIIELIRRARLNKMVLTDVETYSNSSSVKKTGYYNCTPIYYSILEKRYFYKINNKNVYAKNLDVLKSSIDINFCNG